LQKGEKKKDKTASLRKNSTPSDAYTGEELFSANAGGKKVRVAPREEKKQMSIS